ncbi:hypothetical protein [Streptomyces sp. NPDC057686]|uniref:hypothetical protein n=1 Tax=Streptomyces TaxID=1883 RepID=UPI0036BFE3CE
MAHHARQPRQVRDRAGLHRTWSGWVCVSFVLDVYSRMIVGWQLATHMRTDLPLGALEIALWQRSMKKRSLEAGASASVSSVADRCDCQSFGTGSLNDRVALADMV